ncbi:MAG: Rv3235 family protein [bacterium]
MTHPARPALRLAGAQDMLPMSVSLGAPSPHRLFGSELGDFAARPSGRGELPDPVRFGRTFVQALLEVLSARRPVGQLAGHTSPGLQAGLTRDQARGARLDPSGRTPVVHSLRVSEPADGVSEWCAVVRTGGRYRAMAGRLEGLDGRWRCTRLQIG